ncbi:MAG: division/cell wall cluster transcriptional repressor MraZ [Phycisphaerales bacterium]|nr:division/cell wall cluster transcriptional repressor MraZ [Phycisphaerales bacterium]
MNSFLGEFEATLDTKGRFLLPGGLKKQLPTGGEGDNLFVVNRGFDKYLHFYPLQSWQLIVAQIKELNDFDPEVRQFKLLFLGGATEVEIDSAGRLLLPATLREFAGITKDIVLASSLDKIHIWDAGKYKKSFEEFSPAQFSALASKVMGDKKIN